MNSEKKMMGRTVPTVHSWYRPSVGSRYRFRTATSSHTVDIYYLGSRYLPSLELAFRLTQEAADVNV
jgi:hypothetical protein